MVAKIFSMSGGISIGKAGCGNFEGFRLFWGELPLSSLPMQAGYGEGWALTGLKAEECGVIGTGEPDFELSVWFDARVRVVQWELLEGLEVG